MNLPGQLDPPRQDAIRSIADCHDAGIRVKMITGDHAITAGAIARKLGLGNTERVLTGKELDLLDDQAMTPAVDQARKAGIKFRIETYPHDPSSQSYGSEAAEKLGIPRSRS
jgi:magnesium-transporting ATPase (P-type)